MTVLEFTQKYAVRLSQLLPVCYLNYFVDEEDGSIIGVNIILQDEHIIEKFFLDFFGLEIMSITHEGRQTSIYCSLKNEI
jgi:hypothetical protein